VNFLAKVVSIVFHPLLMVTYLFGLFALAFPVGLDPLSMGAHRTFIMLIFGFTFLIPALQIGLLRLLGTIKSLTMEQREERILPFIFISILYGVVTYLFYMQTGVGMRDNLFRFLLIADALVIVSTLTTFVFKVSVHSVAVWGFIGIIVPLNKLNEDGALIYPSILALVIAGLVMSARLQLNAHTPREVLVGSILGMATSLAGMLILF
jgi:membrane-associated phospholipid phosphatase